ncbi:thymidine phosphorylase [Loigolactobacillus backii]|uniref:thymidine phosphorylase n=1 Tax=Loigolactobacillus backii TaxID=375175 RepID=UPI000C1C96A0|nr:thymidine phosphorylase [Loigolactobacillus backii]PIO84212.1 thymidine phosphorylase [Loigolactobacillus backii]
MQMTELIAKKRHGEPLSADEISFLIKGLGDNGVTDAQMGAFLETLTFKDSTDLTELTDFTMGLAYSGGVYDLSAIQGIKVDKHATGGLGDKTSLILLPLVASLGIPVAKLSQRSFNHSGGTLDKLESIPGFRVNLTPDEFVQAVKEIGLAIAAPVDELAPAEQKLRRLRHETDTMAIPSLVASSTLSQNIATGADAVILDIKTGSGHDLLTEEQAEQLAHLMVNVGNEVGRRTLAVVSDMSQPLGHAIGNGVEVVEAIATLKNGGPTDLRKLVLELGTHMAQLGGYGANAEDTRAALIGNLATGKALAKFRDLIVSQGGDPDVIDHPEKLTASAYTNDVRASSSGYVSTIDVDQMGHAIQTLNAGRKNAEQKLDLAAGIVLRKKIGDSVEAGEVLATVYSSDADSVTAQEEVRGAIELGEMRKDTKLIHQVVAE